ncbi:MAG TPA: hypothetical protein VMV81_12410 [Phycisphaerae bacterium]|nr:hypothetical protein [Phycisphaerae bacterium]
MRAVRQIPIITAISFAAVAFLAGPSARAASVIQQGAVTIDASTGASGASNPVAPPPQISEGALGHWASGTDIIITAPLNYAFDTSALVTAVPTPVDPTFALAANTVTPTANTITFHVAAAATVSIIQLEFDNIRLKATACSPFVHPGDTASVTVAECIPPGCPPAAPTDLTGNPLIISPSQRQTAPFITSPSPPARRRPRSMALSRSR